MKEYLATSRSGLMMLAVLPAAFVVSGFALLALGGALKLIAILALILVGIGFLVFIWCNQISVLCCSCLVVM
ncbi:hypothetical protein Rhein_0578 [Rheinheimera sp. A13L]|uniref:hypothetical protein n=1 Tax=Rheinheimera sp. A13L TaxID=506534 RepID=UPI0002124E49|nr:hypothetical protein [Rheinheimera sp. A13L]EGM79190.1 hypothetical protein Rhein_0578 [Rheinheimera sp. A13L]